MAVLREPGTNQVVDVTTCVCIKTNFACSTLFAACSTRAVGRCRADKSLLPSVFDLRARPASVGLGRAGKQTGPLACSTLSRGPGSSRQFGEASFGGGKDRLTKLFAGPGSGGPGRARSQADLIVCLTQSHKTWSSAQIKNTR